MKIELEKQDHFGQITALMFLTGNLLLVGTGSFVKLYDINIPNSPLITLPVLNKSRVHNIIKTRLIPNGIELHNPQKNAFHITDSIPLETIMVLGGKTISFLSTHLQLIKTVEFRDWIQCARVLSDGTIAILYSHNFLELWDLNSGLLKSVSLEVRCMLYSGDIFGTSWNTLNVASGTIFNTVLIWSPIDNQNGVARVQQRLNGHEGVIHGVRFNSDGSMICSTSDDRTVRIWKLTGDVLSPMVLYGHLGRVWKADFVSNYIISISEDATCRVWNPNDGNCIECFSGHGSKHVWSFAVNNETNSILATGGGDCGIRLWDLTNLVETHNNKTIHEVSMAPQIAPKTFTFINEHCIVAISDKGQFFFYDQKNETSKMFHEDLDFRAYPVLKANRFMLAAGNMNGVLLIISHYDSFKPLKLKICDSKIVSLYLHQDDSSRAYAFLFIGEKKLLLYLVIDFLSENVEITEQREILLPSDFFVTSLYFSIETFLVFLGSRNGSIMAYDVSKSTAALVSFYEKLHGDDAVTSLAITNTEKLLTVYSVGRDGVFSATQLRPPSSPEKSWVFDKIHSSRITRGWLEKIEIVDDTIYLCGFFDKEFFIFNETKNYQVFKIACGGAHRLWNVHIPNLNLVDFRFGYIRKQRIQLVSKTFNPDRNVLNDILQEPYHCLETRVARIFSMNEVTLVATGGENGVLTFHHILKNVGSSKRIASCRKHTGSIRAIGVISNLSNQNGLLFSGGSVQELKCWRIELSNSSLETENVRMSCNELSSANLCSESVDTRVMDLDAIISITDTQMILVATANSDTSVVLWCYNVEHNSFTKIDVSHKHLRCLLKCKTLSVTIGNHNRILLFTAGTDGKVILWDISENKLQSVCEWTPHQSGIKALSVAEKNGTIFVLSGGDDNAIVLTTINLQSLSSSCVELDTIRIENGHSSSITGCAITKNLQIITCSIDQRLSVRNMDLQLLSETYIDIADVSDLSILSDFICVVGFGMQIFKIK